MENKGNIRFLFIGFLQIIQRATNTAYIFKHITSFYKILGRFDSFFVITAAFWKTSAIWIYHQYFVTIRQNIVTSLHTKNF